MDIYNFLLRKNGYETEDYGYLLFYHPTSVNDTGDVVFDTDLIELETSVKNAERIMMRALEVLAGEEPEASGGCGFCKWAKESRK